MTDARSEYISKARENIEAIRKRARQHNERGAVTDLANEEEHAGDLASLLDGAESRL